MNRWLVLLAVACACSREGPAATQTIAPAEPRPAPTVTAHFDTGPVIATAGSPPPASATAPGIVFVTVGGDGIDVRRLLPRGQGAFHIENRTALAHQIVIRGGPGSAGAALPPRGRAVLQLLLGPGRYEIVCTVPGHAERAAFETYMPGAPLATPTR